MSRTASVATDHRTGVVSPTPPWYPSYAGRLAITDTLTIIVVMFGTQAIWIETDLILSGKSVFSAFTFGYLVVSVASAALWIFLLAFYGTRGRKIIGHGSAEYKIIINASFVVAAVIPVGAFLFKFDLSRGYVLVAFPLGVGALLLERYLWRRWLWARRRDGEYSSRVLVVGAPDACLRIVRDLTNQHEAGLDLVGCCLPGSTRSATLAGTDLRVFGNLDQVSGSMTLAGADTVLVAGSEQIPPSRLRQISWDLAPGQHLIVASNLTDIAGPRMHMRPVANLPLIHVETPRLDSRQRFTKRTFDIVGSGLLLFVLSPMFLVVSLAVRLSGPGPIFYSQVRIGINGEPFNIYKFRTMIVGANDALRELLEQQGNSDRPLFKIQNDPRITPIGRILRKYSLDEFPQLINVFMGDMSLVGPRPQVGGEVELYDDTARRRLVVKPGMSGLWQVSGRSSLSWEDAIRLDLYYVENWSLTSDVSILLKTVKAVVSPGEQAH